MALDPEDRFRDSCSRYKQYPNNLLDARCAKRKLAEWCDKLNDPHQKNTLFDDNDPVLHFFDISDGEDIHKEFVTSQAQLEEYLERGIKDPRLRYVSIEAPSSRDPLDCSLAMFTSLFSYHQIPESFLEHVFSFGGRLEAVDMCLASFQSDDTLSVPENKRLAVPSLGRSGNEIRLSYLLRVVEKSSSSPSWQWGIRPLAIYHSFDVLTGRAVWVTVKGNKFTRDQIQEELSDKSNIQSASADSPGDAFLATLSTQLFLLESTQENWRWYLNDVETSLRKIVNKAKTAKIDTEPHFSTIPNDIKEQVFRSSTTNLKPGVRRETTLRSISSRLKQLMETEYSRNTKKTRSPGWHRINLRNLWKRPKQDKKEVSTAVNLTRLDKYLRLDIFSFEDVQNLQHIAETIQEALLAIQLDITALQETRAYYEQVIEHESVPENVRVRCKHIKSFLASIKRVETNLGVKHKQWKALEKLVRDGKILYDGIMQYRSLQLSRIYAESAHASARKMEKIAGKTEEETASMHIITFVTLVFLPGTFIASFLQSGVFQWNELGEGKPTWTFKSDACGLFVTISSVLMIIAFMVWFLLFGCLRRRSLRQFDNVEDDGLNVV